MRHVFLFLLIGGILLNSSLAQSLARRPLVGIRLAPISDSLRSDPDIPSTGGIFVQHVFPNSSASAAGIMAGDLIWEINKQSFDGPADFLSHLRVYDTGDKICLKITRNGKERTLKLKLLPFPSEIYEHSTIYYSSVLGNSGPLRTMLSLPNNPVSKPPPVVFLIQGIDCGSVDVPFI